jgi:MFS family permease
MAEVTTEQPIISDTTGFRQNGPFVLASLTSGHGLFHWFSQSLTFMLPEIRDTFGISTGQVSFIAATRELVSGIVAMPGGIFTDMVRRQWGLILACCMGIFGLGWVVMGFSPIYPVVLAGMVLVALSTALWHLPAMAAISRRFPERRGSALSLHGVGGNIGDVIAMVITGFLLGFLGWQGLLKIYAIIPLFLVFVVLWSFKDIGRYKETTTDIVRPDLSRQLAQTRALFRNPRLWGISLASGVRGMAFVSFMTFLPLYLYDELGFSGPTRGFYLMLPLLVGIPFTPLMGYLSDRVGRKLVLIPGMLLLGSLTFLLVPYGQGLTMILLLVGLGTFLNSDQPLLTSAALDTAGRDVAAATLGFMSFSRLILAAAAPPIGSIFYNISPDRVFIYIGVLFAVSISILIITPIPKPLKS